MGEAEVAALLRGGRVREVPADRETALGELEIAQRHVASARLLLDADPTLSFVALYDAMRKAISAHMRANGLRVTGGPGQHMKVGEYARAALEHLDIDDHLAEFDTLRDLRNQSEYDALWVKPGDVTRAVVHVAAILEAVTADLERPPPTT